MVFKCDPQDVMTIVATS